MRGLALSHWQAHLDSLLPLLGSNALITRLNALAAESEATAGLRFEASHAALGALDYERAIVQSGAIPTRLHAAHDVFNAAAWLAFPRTKALINRLHLADANAPQVGANGRTRRRDGLSLFDEAGIVLITIKNAHPRSELHRQREWHRLLADGREAWRAEVQALPFGHGMFQQWHATGHPGLTGKALWVEASADGHPDIALARHLESIATDELPNQLLPLPIVGVPGWWLPNALPDFYKDADLFRPLRPLRPERGAEGG